MKNYLIVTFSLLFSVSMMAIGYAKLSGILELNSNAINNSRWDVRIISIHEYEIIGNAKSISKPTNTNLTATFNAKLSNVNDSIKYKVTVKNNGNIDAKLNSAYIIPTPSDDDIILYSVENIYDGEVLKVGEEKEFFVKVKYNNKLKGESLSKSVLISLEYVQYS